MTEELVSKKSVAFNESKNQYHGRVDELVWVSHPEEIWILGKVIDADGPNHAIVQILSGPKGGNGDGKVKLNRKELFLVNRSSPEDMTSLHHLHEPGILSNLNERYSNDYIYTYMGAAMIAVNPYKKVPEPKMIDYMSSKAGILPHPFTISENCYKNLSVLKKNQSIIISGESGAGKTETAKIVIKYLAERNRQAIGSSKQDTSCLLYEKLIQMSPILESFGNARTSRNSNSSRFGKFMKLLYSTASSNNSTFIELYGAIIETYLLEKSRVVYQNDGEQNFHIFYSILETLPSVCNLDARYQFRIARKGANASPSWLDSSHRLDSVSEAFLTLGISRGEIDGIWKILSALLYLGNVAFENFDSAEGAIAKISAISDQVNTNLSSMSCLKIAADLLGVDINTLKNVITQREVETRGEKFRVSLSVREASFARDATIKAIYEALYNYIVKLINRSIISSNAGLEGKIFSEKYTSNEKFIGVLDIFGFESFERNGFEQLLINYANEALQNTFNKQIFDKEIQLFEEEKIEINIGECPNNLKCVELIAAKNESIFCTLDTISRQPQPSDERFCEELHKAFTKKSPYFGTVHRKDMKNLFIIHHYATSVNYSVGNMSQSSCGNNAATKGVDSSASANNDNAWIGKNNDAIPDGLEVLYQQSSLPEFRALGPTQDSSSAKQEPKRRKSVMMKPTIVATFGKSMQELNEILEQTSCHFIRCIKPNPIAKPNLFQFPYVIEQIRALGILQACEILSVSLPTRISYSELKNALSSTIPKVVAQFPMLSTQEGNVLLIATILRAYQVPEDAYRLGVTIAFFKPGQLSYVDRILNTAHDPSAENMIVRTIEATINQYTLITQDISNISQQVKIAVEFINELEIRQDRLRNNITILPQDIGLDLPENVAKRLGDVEGKFNSQQMKRKDLIKQKLKLEALISSKGLVKGKNATADRLYDKCQQLLKSFQRVEDRDFLILTEKYDRIHHTVESLEESNSRKIDPALRVQVENNDAVYEQIMDRVSSVERLISEVKLLAQRCKIDAAYAKYASINQEIIEVNEKTKVLSNGIDIANTCLQEYEDALNNVNFSELEKEIQEYFTFFNDLISSSGSITDQYSSLYNELFAFSFEVASPHSPPPPPPPKSSGSTFSAANTFPGVEASINSSSATPSALPPEKPKRAARDGENIRGSVNYSIKDLAAMKKRGSATSTIEENTALTKSLTSNTISVGSATEELPADWMELFDPKSQRCYYVNKLTKQRQWQRPTNFNTESDAISVQSGSSSVIGKMERIKSVRLLGTGKLPPNWREIIDKKSGRPYYVNDVTKERQWRRPEAIITTSDISPTKIESIDRLSRRISRKMTNPNLTEALKPVGQKGSKDSLTEERIARARRTSALILSEELTSNEDISEDMKQSVSYLSRVGHQVKTGYLQKQSKLLQRWRKRYFVLSEQKLFYFDTEKEYLQAMKNFNNNPNLSLKAEKQFIISSKTQVSFTTTDNCFSLVNPSEAGAASKESKDAIEDTWYLLAENEESQEDWMKALNGHVHVKYVQDNKLLGKDYWDLGNVSLSLWKVPSPYSANTARRPVGIRSVPDVDGPRTGEGLFAGDIVEIVQTIEERESSQRYLRLADDRGWVFENHPSANYAILVPVGGKLVEIIHTYEYPIQFLEPLCVYSNPKCSHDFLTEQVFSPGARLQTCAEWTVSSDLLSDSCDEEEEKISLCFLKLRESRGWVQMYHPVTGGKLLQLLE